MCQKTSQCAMRTYETNLIYFACIIISSTTFVLTYLSIPMPVNRSIKNLKDVDLVSVNPDKTCHCCHKIWLLRSLVLCRCSCNANISLSKCSPDPTYSVECAHPVSLVNIIVAILLDLCLYVDNCCGPIQQTTKHS